MLRAKTCKVINEYSASDSNNEIEKNDKQKHKSVLQKKSLEVHSKKSCNLIYGSFTHHLCPHTDTDKHWTTFPIVILAAVLYLGWKNLWWTPKGVTWMNINTNGNDSGYSWALQHAFNLSLYEVNTLSCLYLEKIYSGPRLSNTVGVGTHIHDCLKPRLLNTLCCFYILKIQTLPWAFCIF